jgi:hypothetical protein
VIIVTRLTIQVIRFLHNNRLRTSESQEQWEARVLSHSKTSRPLAYINLRRPFTNSIPTSTTQTCTTITYLKSRQILQLCRWLRSRSSTSERRLSRQKSPMLSPMLSPTSDIRRISEDSSQEGDDDDNNASRKNYSFKRAEEPLRNTEGKLTCVHKDCTGLLFERKCEWR